MDALDGSAAADPAEVRPVGDRHAQTSFGRPMHAVDYCLIVALLACTVVGNWRATRHTQSVADFVAANRAAGPYLLATADGTAGLGAISIVASFEQFYAAGLAPRFWGFAATPISMIITLSGYVRWRYRATRCLTMSEFFEYRYGSKRLRILAGGLCWFSGVVNMGIFPGVGTRFFINFCELPTVLFGGAVDSFPIVMFFALSVSVYFTISGGQVAVIVTDFAQGFFCAIFFVVVCVYLGMSTSWQQAADSLQAASLPGKSLFDAFDIGEAASFNGFYYLSGLLLTVYGTQSWQGDAGYNAAAITPHAAQMAGIIGRLRGQLQQLALTLLPMAAIVLLNAPAGTIAGNAAAMASDAVGSELQTRYPGNHALQEQQRVPTALKVVLPPGLRGGFAAAMLGFFISTHTTYLQAWGSILVQDVLIPTFGPQSKATHLRWLRRSVILVAALIFLWSWLMPTRDYILMFFALSGAIWNAGAGSCIVGGLYWRRGTAAGATAALVTGATTSLAALAAQIVLGTEVFTWNGQEILFCSSCLSLTIYVAGSLLSDPDPRGADIVNRLEIAAARGGSSVNTTPAAGRQTRQGLGNGGLLRLIGATASETGLAEFSRTDKALVMFTLGVGTLDIVALLFPLILRLEKPEWLQYWHGLLGLNAALAFLFSGWFLLGGLHDLSRFFSQLERAVRDYGDDGSSAWAQRARAECGVEAVGATATAHGLPAAENAINLEQVVATERKGLLAGEATRCERLRSDDAMEEASATVPSDAARA